MTGSRSSRGDGSVFFRPDRQRWVAVVDFGFVEGRRKRPTRSFEKKKDALAWKNQVLAEHRAGLPTVGRTLTVEAWLKRWLDDYVDPSRRAPATKATYRSLVSTHLLPALGQKRLVDLNQEDVSALFREMAKTRRQSTIQQTKVVLTCALAAAMQNDLILRNVASLAPAPRAQKATKTVRPLTDEQRVALFKAAEGHPLRALLVLAAALGLRRGELLGLQWRDLDETPGVLHVRRQVVRGLARQPLSVQAPKASSGRSLQLPGQVIDLLTDYRAVQEAQWPDRDWNRAGWLFPNEAGGPRDPSNVNRVFTSLYRRAGIEQRGLHLLRHTAGTKAYEAGVDMKTVMEMFGHKTLAVTDKYVTSTPALHERAAKLIDGTLMDLVGA